MKDKRVRVRSIIIAVELFVLISLCGYRIYEVSIDKEPIQAGENNEELGQNDEELGENDDELEQGDDELEENDDNTAPSEPIETETKENIKILLYKINIRKEASEDSAQIGTVYINEIFKVLDMIENDDYSWYKIKKGNVTGWVANKKGESGIEYTNANEDKIIYYTVTIDEDNGSEPRQIRVKKNKEFTFLEVLKTPIKENYKFRYWTIAGNEVDYSSKVNRDVTVVAKYYKYYHFTLVYDEYYTRIVDILETNLNSYDENGNHQIDPYHYKNGKYKMIKEGHEFKGWYQNGIKFNFSEIPTSDNIVLEARYEKVDGSYLNEYRKFETQELSAEFIYELDKKIKLTNTGGKCGFGSYHYYDMIGKTSDYTLDDKLINMINTVESYIKCGTPDVIEIDNNRFDFGCYIPEETIEKNYKYIYGNDSYYKAEIVNAPTYHTNVPFYSYDASKKAYFKRATPFGICSFGFLSERIIDVKKYDDRIEIVKSSIFAEAKYHGEDLYYYIYDYDNDPIEYKIGDCDKDEIESKLTYYIYEGKLDTYTFVFKKDSKDNYYLYEVKKEEAK